jgi:hypothetical protein
MKALKSIVLIIAMLVAAAFSQAQEQTEDRLNLPGDNLNLFAVMKLFQESETLEGFERNLNAEESKINNLDLNGDELIDYIKVNNYVDGDNHTIVLQVAVNEKENQDVAVITVSKDEKGQVQVQLIGDEYLYGKDYIVEPIYEDATAQAETPNPAYQGETREVNGETVVVKKTTYVEVQTWPVVRYIYQPTYVVWRSPWYWGYYPSYWRPWRPYYWHHYYGYHYHWHWHYYGHYHRWDRYRYPNYSRNYYYGHRNASATVRSNRDSGRYKNTYSRPETRQEGSREFTKRHPNLERPAVRPSTGGSNTGRPAVRPGDSRPGNQNVSRPTGRPGGSGNVDRPATKPGTTRPAVKPGNDRPSRKPAVKPEARPGRDKAPGSSRDKQSNVNRHSNSSRKSEPARSSRSTNSSGRSSGRSSGSNR